MGSPARAGIDHIINAGNTKCFGSPARAGIDLGSSATRLSRSGFPRTRGDRPGTAKRYGRKLPFGASAALQ